MMVDIETDAAEAVARLEDQGLKLVPFGPRRLRAVLHRDASDEDVAFAADVFTKVLKGH